MRAGYERHISPPRLAAGAKVRVPTEEKEARNTFRYRFC